MIDSIEFNACFVVVSLYLSLFRESLFRESLFRGSLFRESLLGSRMPFLSRVLSRVSLRVLLTRASASATLALLLLSVVATAEARSRPGSFADLAEKLSPSVVNIQARYAVSESKRRSGLQFEFRAPPGSQLEELFRQFREQQGQGNRQQRRRSRSQGSGFVIDSKGLIVTNNHVIDKAESILVVLQDGTKLAAEVVGRDIQTDLALLRVKHEKALPAVSWGDSNKTRVGDWVMAIGNPLGFGGSVTAGIVSARGRNIRAGPYDDFIQTDAPINRGNSGGPLFDLSGRVIGINTAIVSPSGGSIGIGFAIPSRVARTIIDQLGQHGAARRAWMGIAFQPVTEDIAQGLGWKRSRKAEGVIVTGVAPKSPAAHAGIKSGDVIVSYNRKKVTRDDRLPWMVAQTPVGKTVPVEVLRSGKRLVLSLKVARLSEERLASARQGGAQGGAEKEKSRNGVVKGEVKTTALPALGVEVVALTETLRSRNKVPRSVEGVVVVKAGIEAREKGLQRGALIREINGVKVASIAAAGRALAKAKKAGRKAVLLKISDLQGKRDLYIGVPFKAS